MELLDRLSRLEGIVKDIEGQESPTTIEQRVAVPGDRKDSKSWINDAPNSAPARDMDKYMASSFWENLTEQINGLKDVLAVSSNDEDENDEDQTPVSGSSASGRPLNLASNHSGFVLSRIAPLDDMVQPTQHQTYTLCEIFLANVDPVYKCLHAPSVRKHLQENKAEMDCSPGLGGLEALRSSIFYAAVTSLADGECKHRLGEGRDVLLTRYRGATEIALAKADFINTVEMSTLQALALYLVAVRSNDSSRCMWTLTSVAIRIAQAMGLHYDNTSASLPPFEREIRRRLWWQICDLDTHAAADRASFPLIFASSFNTRLPLQINDEDITPGSLEEVDEQEGFTDMTFTLSCNEIFDALRKLNHTPLREIDEQYPAPELTWAQRVDTVIQFQKRMDQKYLGRLNLNRPFHWFTRMVVDIVVATMWLFVYRPLQRRPKSNDPSQRADPGILGLAVDVLERGQQLYDDPAGSQYQWVSRTYVQWHALSVTAAELCVDTQGPMVERAWTIVEPAFTRAALHVADSDTGMLWRPIKKLMRRAREVRQQHLNSHAAAPASALPAFQDQIPQNAMFSPANPGLAGSPPGSSPFSRLGVPRPGPLTPAAPIDWDVWLNAATAPDPSSYSGPFADELHELSWTNWQGFIDEVQGQNNPIIGPFNPPP